MSWKSDVKFASKVADCCKQAYEKQKKKGKKTGPRREWTLLACVCVTVENANAYTTEVISLGTGSKCLGESKLRKSGDVVNDSHAEIIARRSFLCYLYEQLLLVHSGKESEVLTVPMATDDWQCSIKEGVDFHFFSSHTPCGDASIFPKEVSESSEDGSKVTINLKRKREASPSDSSKEKCVYVCSESDMSSSLNCLNPENRKTTSSISKCKKKKDSGNLIDQKEESEHLTLSYTETSFEKNHNLEEHNKEVKNVKQDFSDENEILKPIDRIKENFCCENVCERKDCNNIHRDNQTSDAYPVSERTNSEKPKDIYRTGAKCVAGGDQDSHGSGVEYHTVSALRIKPGRGDRTISMSCSDKIARWNILGCQGALLSHFLTGPIYFRSYVTGRCPYNETAMKRAIIDRVSKVQHLPPGYHINKPVLLQSDWLFVDGKEALEIDNPGEKIVPSSAAISWFKGCTQSEVTVLGRKQGTTKKTADRPEARCRICSIEFLKRFTSILENIEDTKIPKNLKKFSDLSKVTYHELKEAAVDYQDAWAYLQKEAFNTWIKKSRDYLQFISE